MADTLPDQIKTDAAKVGNEIKQSAAQVGAQVEQIALGAWDAFKQKMAVPSFLVNLALAAGITALLVIYFHNSKIISNLKKEHNQEVTELKNKNTDLEKQNQVLDEGIKKDRQTGEKADAQFNKTGSYYTGSNWLDTARSYQQRNGYINNKR